MEATHHVWENLPEDAPLALLTRRRVVGEQAMLSRVALQKGCVVDAHAHENEQFACLLEGALRFELGTAGSDDHRELVVRAGEVLHLPANVRHSAEALEDSVVLDVFSPPSEGTGIDKPQDG